MAVNWGKELIQIYNDAAIPVFGEQASGRDGPLRAEELPGVLGVLAGVESLVENISGRRSPLRRAADQRMRVNRHGLLEEAYFTFSLSPMLADAGAVLGILNTYVETTSRVLG